MCKLDDLTVARNCDGGRKLNSESNPLISAYVLGTYAHIHVQTSYPHHPQMLERHNLRFQRKAEQTLKHVYDSNRILYFKKYQDPEKAF